MDSKMSELLVYHENHPKQFDDAQALNRDFTRNPLQSTAP